MILAVFSVSIAVLFVFVFMLIIVGALIVEARSRASGAGRIGGTGRIARLGRAGASGIGVPGGGGITSAGTIAGSITGTMATERIPARDGERTSAAPRVVFIMLLPSIGEDSHREDKGEHQSGEMHLRLKYSG